jgi:hypothetical protein
VIARAKMSHRRWSGWNHWQNEFVLPSKEGKNLIDHSSDENFPIKEKDLENPCTKPQKVVHTEPRLANTISLQAMKTRAQYQMHPVSQFLARTVLPPHAIDARISSQNRFISTCTTFV